VAFFEFIESMFNVESAVMLLTALAAFATILTLTAPLMNTDKLGTRMKLVSTEREAMRARAREALAQEKTRLRQMPTVGFKKRVVEMFAHGNMLENAEIKGKLRQAGFRGPGPMYTFIFFRFVMPPILFVVTLLYLVFLNDFGLQPMARFAASCGAASSRAGPASHYQANSILQQARGGACPPNSTPSWPTSTKSPQSVWTTPC